MQVGCYVQPCSVEGSRNYFAYIMRPAVGRQGPQYISEIFQAEMLGSVKILECRVDLGAPLLRLHQCFALRVREQGRRSEIDEGRLRAVCVVNGLYTAHYLGDGRKRARNQKDEEGLHRPE